MASEYPGAVDTFTTKEDKVDLYEAAHINDLQNAIVATQTELGTDVAGSATDLKTRIARCIADNGAMKQGTSFPGSPVEGDFFYKTDEDLMYIYDGSDWDAMGGALSNVVFNWFGTDSAQFSTDLLALYIGSTLSVTAPGATASYMYYVCDSTSATDMILFKYRHVAGINTITIHARLWVNANTGTLTVNIGAANNSVTTVSTSPVWVTTADIDVSGLSEGTVYACTCQLKNSNDGVEVYCSAVQLIAS